MNRPDASDAHARALPVHLHASKRAFVAVRLSELLRGERFALARANRQKFLIRKLNEARIRALRRQAVGKASQQALFEGDVGSRLVVSEQRREAIEAVLP